MKNTLILLAAIALASCAAPKAVVVAEAPKRKQPAAAPAETPIAHADDDMRLPEDLLALPEDSQLRSSAPISKDGDATIITSPPSE